MGSAWGKSGIATLRECGHSSVTLHLGGLGSERTNASAAMPAQQASSERTSTVLAKSLISQFFSMKSHEHAKFGYKYMNSITVYLHLSVSKKDFS